MIPLPTRNPQRLNQPPQQGGFFGSNFNPNMSLILGGIAGMSGANPAPYYGMGKNYDDQRRQELQRHQFRQMLNDPANAGLVDKRMLPFLANASPEVGLKYLMQRRLQDMKSQHQASVSYGKTGAVFQGNDGRFYTVQFASDGTRKVVPLQEGMTPAKGVATVDTGTGTRIINKSTGQDIRSLPKDIEGAERAKVVGKSRGTAQAELPKNVEVASQMLSTIDQLIKHPNREWLTGASSMLPTMPGSRTHQAQALHDQIKGQVFLQAYQQLKGSGQITEIEGIKAEAALARLNTSQRDEDYLQALQELRGIVQKSLERSYREAGIKPPSAKSELDRKYPGFKIRRLD